MKVNLEKVILKIVLKLGVIISLMLVVWEGIVLIFNLPAFILPAPLEVFRSLYNHLGLIAKQAIPTILETILGFVFGSLLGMIAAISITYFRAARTWFLPILIVSQALPFFIIAPLMVIWWGYGMASKVIITMIMLFFPVASNFYDGLQATSKEWLQLGGLMRGSRWRLLWLIRIPAALPELGNGLRLAASYAPMGAIIGEWVGANQGLGFLIINANARLQMDLVFAVMIVLMIFALILYFSIDLLLKKIIFWQST